MPTDLIPKLVFEGHDIRSRIEEQDGKQYFSVVDTVAALLDLEYDKARKYWNGLKRDLINQGAQPVCFSHQLRLPAADGKMRLTDVADAEGMLRIIQSIPSPKVEPYKRWLARVGAERIEETLNPELGIARSRERAKAAWEKQGKSKDWVEKRLKGIDKRNELTDTLKNHGVTEPKQYGLITNAMHINCMGISVKEHKELKGIKGKNLRDHMTTLELTCIEVAETVTRAIAEERKTQGFDDNLQAAIDGGSAGGVLRETIEKSLGRSIVSPANMLTEH